MTRAGADLTRLAATEAGSGEPVVLLHGSASSSGMWRALREALYDRHHVIAPDLVGYGATPRWPHRRRIAMSDHRALLARRLERLASPVHLVGHAFGGAVALRFAQDHPGRVRSLSLIEPVAPQALADGRPRHRRLLAGIASLLQDMRLCEARGAPAHGVEAFVDFWSGEGTWRKLDADLRADLIGRSRTIIADLDAVVRDAPGVAALERLRAPTLIVSGSRSRTLTVRIASVLARAIPNAFGCSVQGAGHMLPLSHAVAVNRLVAAHIARHGAASTVVELWPPHRSETPATAQVGTAA